ncbi:MAG: SMP-30/gluconolactonase/LRE family protein [Pseudomonadota bacterium]
MSLDLEEIRFIGDGLVRPECTLAHESGLVIVPDWTPPGGVSLIAPSGRTHRLLASAPGPGVETPVRANGIALEEGGTILIAHLGETQGGIYRLHADGRCTLVTAEIDSKPMPPANFVLPDSLGRLWITVSTTLTPRARDYRPEAASGLIALHDGGTTRVVASGLGYTNECLLAEDERTLFVNETFGRRLTAYDVAGGKLTGQRRVAVFGAGRFPDGLAPAADGSLIVTSIVSNAVLRVSPEGEVETLLEDAEASHLAWVEGAFRRGDMGRPHLDEVHSKKLRNISNLAFAGADLETAVLGCLLGDRLATLRMPMPGRPLPHWKADLGPLARYLEDSF